MPPEQTGSRAYFDTPARAERLQLLLHLVRNAGEVVYLRAPAGAGKTLFAHQLLQILDNEAAIVWIRAGLDTDIAGVTADQLGLQAEDLGHWPDAVLEQIGDQDLLIVVDDADQLELAAVERLTAMHARGGRLLLLGHGGLAKILGDWDVQFVDLPPFDSAQSAAFLRSQAADDGIIIMDDLAAALHQAAHGLPGPLLDGLKEVEMRAHSKPLAAASGWPKIGGWQWLVGGAVVILLIGILVFQDRINTLFEPETADAPQTKDAPPPSMLPLPSAAKGQVDAPPAALHEAPVERLARSTGGRLPEISLPELSPLAPPKMEPPPAAQSPSAATASTAASGAEQVPAEPPTDEASLDAVMRDALSAVPLQQAEQPGSAERAEPGEPVKPEADVVPAAPAESAAVAAAPVITPARRSAEVVAHSESPTVSPPASRNTPVRRAEPPTEVAAQAVPVEDRPAPVVPKAVTPPPTAEVAPPPSPPAVVSRTTPSGGLAWLRSRHPGHYTLQLVGGRDRASVEKFVRVHKITQPYAVFERQLDGRPWFSLVVGDYPDRSTAVAARDRLPKGLVRSDVWPRTFESIHKSL